MREHGPGLSVGLAGAGGPATGRQLPASIDQGGHEQAVRVLTLSSSRRLERR